MSSADEVDFPYRAMSSAAVASVVFAVFALVLGFFFWPALGLALVGLIAGISALGKIMRFPEEFDGRHIAVLGLVLNAVVIAAGAGMHVYIYMTEVPDGYTRVPFYVLQQEGE